jgi:hypothetical protein
METMWPIIQQTKFGHFLLIMKLPAATALIPFMKNMNVVPQLLILLGFGVMQCGLRMTVTQIEVKMLTYDIPKDEQENILDIYWQMLMQIESHTKPEKQPLDAHLVEAAYKVLDRAGLYVGKPRWKEKLNT